MVELGVNKLAVTKFVGSLETGEKFTGEGLPMGVSIILHKMSCVSLTGEKTSHYNVFKKDFDLEESRTRSNELAETGLYPELTPDVCSDCFRDYCHMLREYTDEHHSRISLSNQVSQAKSFIHLIESIISLEKFILSKADTDEIKLQELEALKAIKDNAKKFNIERDDNGLPRLVLLNDNKVE